MPLYDLNNPWLFIAFIVATALVALLAGGGPKEKP